MAPVIFWACDVGKENVGEKDYDTTRFFCGSLSSAIFFYHIFYILMGYWCGKKETPTHRVEIMGAIESRCSARLEAVL